MQASVQLSNINQSEPIELTVHPITQNISYLYPRSNLYPSSSLYLTTRTIRFVRTYDDNETTRTQNIDYILPDDLLYYDSENYDEFILNYDSHTCQVRKKCKYNADGTVGLLSSEVVTDYTYPTIQLEDGDYQIKILNYNIGYLSVRLMAQNIYTTQFATKTEVTSQINQKADSITASVNQTFSNYSTTNQMNSAIQLKANEITSSVNETYATKTALNTVNSNLSSQITQKANEITSSVSETYATKSALNSATSTLNSAITQTASSITSQVSATYATKTALNNNVTTLKSTITQTANNLQSQITNNDNDISSINQTINGVNIEVGKKYNTSDFTNAKITAKINDGTSNVQISASKISLAGKTINMTSDNITINSNNFQVDKNGNMTCSNANITGTITSSSGTIGGFKIGSTSISASYNDYMVSIGNASNTNRDFLVVRTGTGGNYQYPFFVRGDGTLHAEKATISGSITATSGTFQNCTITNSCSVPASTISGTLATGNIPNLSAGKITSGTLTGINIHGCTITGGTLEYTNATILGTLQIGSSSSHEYTNHSIKVGSETGQNFQLIVQHEGQYWRRLTFKCGVLVKIESSWEE